MGRSTFQEIAWFDSSTNDISAPAYPSTVNLDLACVGFLTVFSGPVWPSGLSVDAYEHCSPVTVSPSYPLLRLRPLTHPPHSTIFSTLATWCTTIFTATCHIINFSSLTCPLRTPHGGCHLHLLYCCNTSACATGCRYDNTSCNSCKTKPVQ